MSENKRDAWEFQFQADELLTECETRAANHADHADYWEFKRAAFDAEMQKTARIEEQAVTGGVQRILRYDQGLQSQVNDATNRRDGHRAKQRSFERWVMCLVKAKGQTLPLHESDVAFFFAEVLPLSFEPPNPESETDDG